MIGCKSCDYTGKFPGGAVCIRCRGCGDLFECRCCGLHFAASKLDSQDNCGGCVNARIAFRKRLADEGSMAPPRRDP